MTGNLKLTGQVHISILVAKILWQTGHKTLIPITQYTESNVMNHSHVRRKFVLCGIKQW